jgi:hypothetical protein
MGPIFLGQSVSALVCTNMNSLSAPQMSARLIVRGGMVQDSGVNDISFRYFSRLKFLCGKNQTNSERGQKWRSSSAVAFCRSKTIHDLINGGGRLSPRPFWHLSLHRLWHDDLIHSRKSSSAAEPSPAHGGARCHSLAAHSQGAPPVAVRGCP